MIDAARQDNALVAIELLLHKLPLIPDYVLEAVKFKSENLLQMFFGKVWSINLPICQAQSPVLM